jgi:hypothetical protein
VKLSYLAILSLPFVLGLSACKSSNAPAGAPAPAASPSNDIRSSDQVVKAFTHFIPSASPQANVELVVEPGFHINANPPTFSYLIATDVQPGKVDGITVGDRQYPPAKTAKFDFADQPLAVYEGHVTIPIPLTAAPGATGQRTIPLKIRVQACDTQQCYPPATLDAALPIDIAAIKR